MIDVLPPGLYEAVFEAKSEDTVSSDLVSGEWVMRCEARTLDDIRALGGNDAADERRFATAARVSEINLGLYRTFAQPVVRAMASASIAEHKRRLHPLRLQYELLSDMNPWMASVKMMAERARENRAPVSADNPFLAAQETVSEQIVASLDAWRDMVETFSERMFLSVYGSPLLQAAVGIDANGAQSPRRPAKGPQHRELLQSRIDDLKSRISAGGLRECLIRGLLYVGMARGAADERGLAAIRGLRAIQDNRSQLTLAEFKAVVREQYYMLLIDQEAALGAIPDLLPPDKDACRKAFAALLKVLSASGNASGEAADRLRQIAKLFGSEIKSVALVEKAGIAKAS